jgi:hypothetical protein
MRSLVIHTVLTVLAASAHADPLPPTVALPVPPLTDVVVENYGHTEVKVGDGSDGKDVVITGKHWTTRLDTARLPGDERAKWTALVGALQKTGWQLSMSGRDWNPPYASMKLVKAGKESWLFMWRRHLDRDRREGRAHRQARARAADRRHRQAARRRRLPVPQAVPGRQAVDDLS